MQNPVENLTKVKEDDIYLAFMIQVKRQVVKLLPARVVILQSGISSNQIKHLKEYCGFLDMT